MSMQINKSAYEKLIKEDIEWLLSNTKDSLERRHIVEVLNYSPERLYASGSSEIPNDLEEAAKSHRSTANYGGDINLAMEDSYKKGAKWQKEQMMDEWLKDRDGCFWDGVEEGKKAMREQMMMELSEKIASAYQLGLADKEKKMVKEAEKPCHTVEEWMEHIKNADQLTKDIFSKGPYNVLYDALNHPYRDCYDAIKEFGELCYQTAREDMMKEAVECKVCHTKLTDAPVVELYAPVGYKVGDKVRIIFV